MKLECTTYVTWPGETLRLWFVDRGLDRRIVVRMETRYPDAPGELPGELQEIVESIRFG